MEQGILDAMHCEHFWTLGHVSPICLSTSDLLTTLKALYFR